MSAEVMQVVEELAELGSSGFRASYVSRQANMPVDEVRTELMTLVQKGQLRLKFQLICPDNSKTIRSYNSEEELPLGEELSDGRCETDEPFLVEKSNIWVTFEPAGDLLRRANRALSQKLKKNCLTTPRRACPQSRPTPWTPSRSKG